MVIIIKIIYNTERLSSILKSLSVLTGISISFLNTSYKPIFTASHSNAFCTVYQSKYGSENCRSCDRKLLENCREGNPSCHICHAGLYDAAMPVIKSGITVGYILMGRLRTKASTDVKLCDSELRRLYSELPFFNEEQLEAVRELITCILFSDAVTIEKNTAFEEACDYIDAHIRDELSVNILCRQLGIGKNKLYQSFNLECGEAVNEYILNTRMNSAKRLLAETEKSIAVISSEVGLHSESYFCRLFKKRFGMTPSEYRSGCA